MDVSPKYRVRHQCHTFCSLTAKWSANDKNAKKHSLICGRGRWPLRHRPSELS